MLENNYQINHVETFIIDEVKELIYDNDKLDEYKQITKELGITENLSIEDKSPIPFPRLKTIEKSVFSTLCPNYVNYKDFTDTPVPLEILKLIKLSIDENYFCKIEIWHDYEKPDPVVIGTTGYWYVYDKSYNHIKNENGGDLEFNSKEVAQDYKMKHKHYSVGFNEIGQYLIGRWADIKASFKELQERAKERYVRENSTRYEKDLKEAQRSLDDVQLKATELFGI